MTVVQTKNTKISHVVVNPTKWHWLHKRTFKDPAPVLINNFELLLTSHTCPKCGQQDIYMQQITYDRMPQSILDLPTNSL